MATTHLQNGVTNLAPNKALGSLTQLMPAKNHVWFNDFDLYTASDWTVTETQAAATQAIVATTDGGILALVNSAADDDINAVAYVNRTFVLPTTKSWWMGCRLKVDDATQSDVMFGLVDVMTGFNPANGVYLTKADDAATFALSAELSSSVTAGSAASAALANDTYTELAIVFDAGTGIITAYMDDSPFANITTLTNVPTVALTPAVGVRNGNANARTLSVDWMFVAVER